MKICGVYKIENKENNKCIIGSSIDIKQRWYTYKCKLNKGSYGNKELQDDWNTYGSDCFTFEVLENCAVQELYVQESFWQEVFAVSLHGYNKNKITKLTRTINIGTKAMSASITEEDVLRIRALLNLEYSAMEIANMTNINYNIIYTIKNKSSWENVDTSTFYDSKDVDYILSAYYCA